MGMLMHHTWMNQQKQNEQPKKAEPAPVEEVKEEKSAETPVKRAGGRRKTTK